MKLKLKNIFFIQLFNLSGAVFASNVIEYESFQENQKNMQATIDSQKVEQVRLNKIIVHAIEEQKLDYISNDELRRFNPISTGDILKGQSSLQLGDSRNGGALDVNIRGIQGQGRVAVTVDGAQQSLDVYRGYAGTQNRSYIDPLLISSVNIEKGPSSKAGGAIGGTVAMKSLDVKDILLDGENAGVRFTSTFGNNGRKAKKQPTHNDETIPLSVETSSHQGDFTTSESRSSSVAAGWQGEKTDFLLAYVQRMQGNYFSGKHGHGKYKKFDPSGNELDTVAKIYSAGEEVLNSSAKTNSVLMKTNIHLTDEHHLGLSFINFRSQYGDVMPSDIFRTGQSNINQYPLSSNRINTFTSQYEYNPKENDWINFDARLWSTQAKTNQLSTSFFSPESQIFRTDRGWSPQVNDRYGLDISNESKFNSLWGDFTVTFDSSVQLERLKPQSSVEISLNDRYTNKLMRDAQRKQYSSSIKIDYMPVKSLHLWSGVNFSHNQIKDNNKKSDPIYENREFKFISVEDNDKGFGYMRWFPDENGQYTAATDPRLNNGIVFENTNNPLEGVTFDKYSSDAIITVEEAERMDTIMGFKLTPEPNQSYNGIAPNFGISYNFLEAVEGYASYTAQTRLPSLSETSIGTHQVIPGKGLEPEVAKNLEIGIYIKDLWNLWVKFNYFNNKIDNFITRYYDPTKWGLMTFSNMDYFNTSGLELQAKHDSGKIFYDFSATYYMKVESCDSKFAQNLRDNASEYLLTQDTPNCTNGGFMGSYVNTQNPPTFSANLTLGTRLFDQRLVFGGRYVYTSSPMTLDRPWQTGVTASQVKYRPVNTFDLFADYKINTSTIINVSLQNLTNRYYLDPLSSSLMPAPGRTLNVGIQFKL